MNREMQQALEADGEKLRQLTGEDHGPHFIAEPKHTPGPWRMHDMEAMTVVAGHPGGEIANCLNSLSTHEQADADARLIALAPEMLAELRRLYARHGEQATADIIERAAD